MQEKQIAEATADYLENVQWAKHPTEQDQTNTTTYSPPKLEGKPIKRNRKQNQFDETPFKIEELNAFLKRAKKRKACGPDEVPIDFFKLLELEARMIVLNICNYWWENGTFPNEKLKAYVASIYKKGNPKNPANYRPISLLNTIYKYIRGNNPKKTCSSHRR